MYLNNSFPDSKRLPLPFLSQSFKISKDRSRALYTNPPLSCIVLECLYKDRDRTPHATSFSCTHSNKASLYSQFDRPTWVCLRRIIPIIGSVKFFVIHPVSFPMKEKIEKISLNRGPALTPGCTSYYSSSKLHCMSLFWKIKFVLAITAKNS